MSLDRFAMKPGARCGWCIDGLHKDCVVVVRCGDTRIHGDKKKTGPYAWICKCEAPSCVKPVKCMFCQRREVEVVEWRCTDRAACDEALRVLREEQRKLQEKEYRAAKRAREGRSGRVGRPRKKREEAA